MGDIMRDHERSIEPFHLSQPNMTCVFVCFVRQLRLNLVAADQGICTLSCSSPAFRPPYAPLHLLLLGIPLSIHPLYTPTPTLTPLSTRRRSNNLFLIEDRRYIIDPEAVARATARQDPGGGPCRWNTLLLFFPFFNYLGFFACVFSGLLLIWYHSLLLLSFDVLLLVFYRLF